MANKWSELTEHKARVDALVEQLPGKWRERIQAEREATAECAPHVTLSLGEAHGWVGTGYAECVADLEAALAAASRVEPMAPLETERLMRNVAARLRTRRLRGEVRVCLGCGVAFTLNHGQRVYCTRNCGRRHRYRGGGPPIGRPIRVVDGFNVEDRLRTVCDRLAKDRRERSSSE